MDYINSCKKENKPIDRRLFSRFRKNITDLSIYFYDQHNYIYGHWCYEVGEQNLLNKDYEVLIQVFYLLPIAKPNKDENTISVDCYNKAIGELKDKHKEQLKDTIARLRSSNLEAIKNLNNNIDTLNERLSKKTNQEKSVLLRCETLTQTNITLTKQLNLLTDLLRGDICIRQRY